MKFEIEIQTHIHLLQLKWPLIALLCRIERFDAKWPSMEQTERKVFNELRETVTLRHSWLSLSIDDLFMPELEACEHASRMEALTNLQSLTFWYETEIDIPQANRCVLFGYYLQFIAPSQREDQVVGLRAMVIKLIESGYSWVNYINWFPVQGLEINEWVFYCLTVLRDEQEILMRKIDAGGVRRKMTSSGQLLLHIVEQNPGIKTAAITRKLGKSSATTKRMLNKLMDNNMVERKGSGRSIYYQCV